MPLLRHTMLASVLLATTLPAAAFLPPKYLSVPDFPQCLGEAQHASYRSWCLPAQQPASCPAESWAQLNALSGADAVPACQVEAAPAQP